MCARVSSPTGWRVLVVEFCGPMRWKPFKETIGAHYTLKFTKENENSVSKNICADSQQIVIKALIMILTLCRPERAALP